MTMTLDEVFDEEPTVTHGEAYREISKHAESEQEADQLWRDFRQEHGDRFEYNGRTVLEFLGY